MPSSIFPPGALIEVSDRGMTWQRDPSRQVLVCRTPERATVRIRVTGSPDGHLSAISGQDSLQAMRIQ